MRPKVRAPEMQVGVVRGGRGESRLAIRPTCQCDRPDTAKAAADARCRAAGILLGKCAPDAAGQLTFNQLIPPGRRRPGNRAAKASHPDPFHALQMRAVRQGRKCKKLHSHFLPILQPAEAQAPFHVARKGHSASVRSHQDRADRIRGLGEGCRGTRGPKGRCAGRSGAVQGFPGKTAAKPPKAAPGPKNGAVESSRDPLMRRP